VKTHVLKRGTSACAQTAARASGSDLQNLTGPRDQGTSKSASLPLPAPQPTGPTCPAQCPPPFPPPWQSCSVRHRPRAFLMPLEIRLQTHRSGRVLHLLAALPRAQPSPPRHSPNAPFPGHGGKKQRQTAEHKVCSEGLPGSFVVYWIKRDTTLICLFKTNGELSVFC